MNGERTSEENWLRPGDGHRGFTFSWGSASRSDSRRIELGSALRRNIPFRWCALGWLVASIWFFFLLDLLGGPTESDAAESVYQTWLLSHGNLGCAYPVMLGHYHVMDLAVPFALSAPLYPILSGAAAWLLRIGSRVPFPATATMGKGCRLVFERLFHWSVTSNSILPTIRLSYLVWPILLISVVVFLKSTGRGKTLFEPMALLIVATIPALLECFADYFHPQDVLAIALAIASATLASRRRWLLAGLLMGLAVTAQQFALLVAVPLFVLALGRERFRFAAAGLASAAVIDVPLIVATHGRALHSILFGSSRVGSAIRSTGGTVLWEANLHGGALLAISRFLPIVLSALVAWAARKTMGAGATEPIPLVCIAGICLDLRLAFEDNLFGYYFMAVAVVLVLADIAMGRIRGSVLAWLGLECLAFNPVHLGFYSNMTSWDRQLHQMLPIVVYAVMALTLLFDVAKRKVIGYKLIWMLVATLAGESQLWGRLAPILTMPNWAWQSILVPASLTLFFQLLMDASALSTLRTREPRASSVARIPH